MNLTEFLKTHTKINNEFIDDFFSLYKPDDKYNFCIDLQAIAKWMETRKCDLKETIVHSYKKNIDYKIIKGRPDGKIGKPSETILLTPKCFKLMAMQTHSKKGILVRNYYYELEQVLDQYKNYIIQGLQEKIKKLENNQKPKINPQKGAIYVIETDDGIGHYKLGKTTNLRKRLTTYSSSKMDDIIPLYVYETDNVDAVEKCVKTYAKEYQYRKYKEVYKADINMLKDLINDCGEFDNNVTLKMKNRTKHQNGGNYYIAIYKD